MTYSRRVSAVLADVLRRRSADAPGDPRSRWPFARRRPRRRPAGRHPRLDACEHHRPGVPGARSRPGRHLRAVRATGCRTAPRGPDGDEALAELARRYFAAYSPATAADFAAWSGLPAARAIELIRGELHPADVGGAAGYRLGTVDPVHVTRLLPAFDNYLLGHRNRAAGARRAALRPGLRRRHHPAHGAARRARRRRVGAHRPSGRVRVTPFAHLTSRAPAGSRLRSPISAASSAPPPRSSSTLRWTTGEATVSER